MTDFSEVVPDLAQPVKKDKFKLWGAEVDAAGSAAQVAIADNAAAITDLAEVVDQNATNTNNALANQSNRIDALEAIHNPPPVPTIVMADLGGPFEKGVARQVNLVATVTPNGAVIDARRFMEGAAQISLEPSNNMDETIAGVVGTRTFRAEADYDNGGTETISASQTVNFYAPTYFGMGPEGSENEAFVKSLTKQLVANRAGVRSFTGVSERFYFAYPDSFGPLQSVRDASGFSLLDSFEIFNLNFTLPDTTVEPYRLYRSDRDLSPTDFDLEFS